MKDDYKSLDVLVGEGSFGKVYLAKNKTGDIVAIKQISKKFTNSQQFKQEITLLMNCNHTNIIQCLDYWEEQDDMFIVTEYAYGGELFNHIRKKHRYNENDAKLIIKQVVSALAYLHSNHVVHLDLKVENLLLKTIPFFYNSDSNDYQPCVKIADFGTSTLLNEKQTQNRLVGTPGYIAPEVISRQQYKFEPDIYSLGVITYILLSGRMPFSGTTIQQVMQNQLDNAWSFVSPQFDHISAGAKDFIVQCMQYEPSRRPTAEQLLSHKWFYDAVDAKALRDNIHSIEDLKGYQMRLRFKAAYDTMVLLRRLAKLLQPQ